ncbi:molybdenum cofactor biosynthesis protein MoaE [Prosthecochloris sp.]|uniref:molybdenum cofactor biosynthesis protein MoaE n=1 Tax=Prosthecochloris sp. TaxID=290513 RepID=UPI0025D33406|nr:molybdenum cofactor biosynthesis protein MoaE [Prosthecochloris sp.]
MVSVSISGKRIDDWNFGLEPDARVGAELIFNGQVRDSEKDEKIGALVYEQYEGMAQKELERIGSEAVERFGVIDLHCVHRIGTIPVGEAAIVVLIRSVHRHEAFDAMSWFMDELKKTVPIWKVGSMR